MSEKSQNKDFKTSDFLFAMRQMRMITIVSVLSCIIACLCFGFLFFKEKSNNEKEIFVVSDAGDFLAKRNDYNTRHEFEFKNHFSLFLQLFYENDQYTFNKNLEQAANLIDKQDFNKMYQGYSVKAYEVYVKNSAHTKVMIDSIKVNMKIRPQQAKVWFKSILYYGGNSKPIYTCCAAQIVDCPRSEKNPYGLILQNVNFFEYIASQEKVEAINDSIAKEQSLKEQSK